MVCGRTGSRSPVTLAYSTPGNLLLLQGTVVAIVSEALVTRLQPAAEHGEYHVTCLLFKKILCLIKKCASLLMAMVGMLVAGFFFFSWVCVEEEYLKGKHGS